MENSEIYPLFESACRYLLNQQNRDPYSPTYGCMDRRYWGWKLVDYAESTFQRNVYPFAWWLAHGNHNPEMTYVLGEAVQAGIAYAIRVQHKDGSFDQAFPHEHSFGATAFLLHPLLETYRIVHDLRTANIQIGVESSLRRASDFLCQHDEAHGMISNHLAGAALSLLASANYFHEPRYEQRADDLLDRVLKHQSPEGWFIEYEGADPGYQSLCLYYLAQVYRLRPTPALREALAKSVDFLAWFIHPDGTFSGEYGSRRTAIYYPGGLALLASDFPLAGSMTRFMLRSIALRHTITAADVDMGNLAPLLSNYMIALEAGEISEKSLPPLPFEQEDVSHDFPQAGLFIRGNKKYYAVVGASNGGVLKVYDREKRIIKWNDSGYAGQTHRGRWVTTQMTDLTRPVAANESEICVEAPFYTMLHAVPTPFQFIILRLLNLTIMRSLWLGNQIKQLLVKMLIRDKKNIPLHLTRVIRFNAESVTVADQLRGRVKIEWLAYGRPFVSIHMASANYFENPETAFTASKALNVSVDDLKIMGTIDLQVSI
jgi:hypothetical protein